jgi:hypothetical protein
MVNPKIPDLQSEIKCKIETLLSWQVPPQDELETFTSS